MLLLLDKSTVCQTVYLIDLICQIVSFIMNQSINPSIHPSLFQA